LPKLPQILDEGNTLAKPKHILTTKVCQHQNRMWNEVLVKWKHYLVDEATWKNEVDHIGVISSYNNVVITYHLKGLLCLGHPRVYLG
jgi:hypothetical protein